MDPIACLASYLEASTNDERSEHVEAWRGWLSKGGFRPLIAQVRAEHERRGNRWTRRHALTCILAGTI